MTRSSKNPEVDSFLSKAKKWQPEMTALRTICLTSGLTEELKWNKPCYTFRGANVVIIQGFKDFCALLFTKGALLADSKRILKKPGENTQAARRIEFTEVGQIEKMAATLKSYLKEAIAAEKAGKEVEFKTTPEPLPAELQQKFKEMPALKKAFNALTPGRQRGYILHFSGAKQSATREARIEKCIPQILEGKGWNEVPARKSKPAPKTTGKDGVVLLSGGNPQIAKADGDAPVQAYIAAMPGWKSGLGKRLDKLVTRHAPNARKAVKWNSPFYGIEGQGWFLSFHVLTKCVKVTFFNGMLLKPVPPGGTERSGNARWIDIHEHDKLDEKQMASWVKQAARLPGWIP